MARQKSEPASPKWISRSFVIVPSVQNVQRGSNGFETRSVVNHEIGVDSKFGFPNSMLPLLPSIPPAPLVHCYRKPRVDS